MQKLLITNPPPPSLPPPTPFYYNSLCFPFLSTLVPNKSQFSWPKIIIVSFMCTLRLPNISILLFPCLYSSVYCMNAFFAQKKTERFEPPPPSFFLFFFCPLSHSSSSSSSSFETECGKGGLVGCESEGDVHKKGGWDQKRGSSMYAPPFLSTSSSSSSSSLHSPAG